MAASGETSVGTQPPAGPPSAPGTYALLLHLERGRELTVGRRGRFRFPAGVYAYAGSARGPGGLAARVRRHLCAQKVRHWHVDTLRQWAPVKAVWFTEGDQRRECAWALALAEMPGASIPARGFGASDCSCPTHLVHFPFLPERSAFARRVGQPVLEVILRG